MKFKIVIRKVVLNQEEVIKNALQNSVKGTSIKPGYFRLYSELFISRQGSHLIASITKVLNADMDDYGYEMIIHDLIEVPLCLCLSAYENRFARAASVIAVTAGFLIRRSGDIK